MTQQRILELAESMQRKIWLRSYEQLEENPNNKIARIKADKAWEELLEIERMLQKEMWGAERV